jgi:excisionase family DNA binding protein
MVTPGGVADPRFMTVAEIAAIMRVSGMTVYRLIHSGQLEAIKVGGLYRVREAALGAYLAGQLVTPDGEARLRAAGHAARSMPLGKPDDWILIPARAGATAEQIAKAGGVPVSEVREVLTTNGLQR